MRSIVINQPAVDNNIELVERTLPAPAADEVCVDVAYCGCNWADTMLSSGTYPHPVPYPFTPGFEISGTINAVGSGVQTFTIGDRVAGYVEAGGGYAEQCIAIAASLFKLPDSIAFNVGAAFPLQGMTAWHMLHTIARVKSGDTVLVHAIGGGVGLYTTQLAVHAGARVLGTVGTPGKQTRALELGASIVFLRSEVDFVDAVKEATDGRGVDIVIDSLGADTLDKSFACVRKLGHVINIGEAEGEPYKNIRERLLPKSLTFTRFHLGHVEPASDLARRAEAALIDGLTAGWLQAPIAGVYPLAQALEMQLALQSRTVPGKLLLEIHG